MNRSLTRWLIFGACLLVLVATLSWVTARTLSLEAKQWEAAENAREREQVRLALWRMEAEASSVVVRESARPARHYQTFPEIDRLLAGGESVPGTGKIREPSPLLGTTPDLVKLHFQCVPLPGFPGLCSPQSPQGPERKLALERFEVGTEVAEAGRRMDEMKSLLFEHRQWESIAGFQMADLAGKRAVAFVKREDGSPIEIAGVKAWASNDQLWRDASLIRKPIQDSLLAEKAPPMKASAPTAATRPMEEEVGDMKTLWLGDELVLLRPVIDSRGPSMQGAWLDWPELEQRLLASVSDLLPEASLIPMAATETRDDWRALVSLPVRLEPGRLPLARIPPPSGLKPALLLAWLCLLGASVAIGFVLHRTIQLSERRAAFVSAVTHELRTPLTTFRLYSEMLAEDAVTEPARRREYLKTLCEESDRLTRLVDNVLTFSRIERTKTTPRLEQLELRDLVARILPRIQDRSRQVGLNLIVSLPETETATTMETDPSVVEQILFNLVDNAAKYAAPHSSPQELHLTVAPTPVGYRFTLRDFGPGLAAGEAKRLFKPFLKSAADAAESAPGVGLGLALCQRLARQLGGDLSLEPPDGRGASFVLSLPRQVA